VEVGGPLAALSRADSRPGHRRDGTPIRPLTPVGALECSCLDSRAFLDDNETGRAVRDGGGKTAVKVVIFCGGLGVRMGPATEKTPKPLIPVGGRPILTHIMDWYATWGHTEFVLCLGHRAKEFKGLFHAANGSLGRGQVRAGQEGPRAPNIDEWSIRFLDTGARASVGERLLAARPYVDDDDVFLCTYGDGLTDAPLDEMIGQLVESGKTGLFMAVRPRLSYHVVDVAEDGKLRGLTPMSSADVRINGGFFVFRRSVFDALAPGDDLVDALTRLAEQEDLIAYRYDGFWAPMDTLKDKQDLDEMAASGNTPWVRSSAVGRLAACVG
jgi:glucose-1-phosphate cytidylyltransferase